MPAHQHPDRLCRGVAQRVPVKAVPPISSRVMTVVFRCRLIDGVVNSSGQSQSTAGWLRMMSTRFEPLMNRRMSATSEVSSKRSLISQEKADRQWSGLCGLRGVVVLHNKEDVVS